MPRTGSSLFDGMCSDNVYRTELMFAALSEARVWEIPSVGGVTVTIREPIR